MTSLISSIFISGLHLHHLLQTLKSLLFGGEIDDEETQMNEDNEEISCVAARRMSRGTAWGVSEPPGEGLGGPPPGLGASPRV